jgi:hypothetical protein
MSPRIRSVFTRALAVGALLAGAAVARPPAARADDGIFDQREVAGAANLPGQEGVQPQARGPVHEAFAAPSSAAPRPGPIATKPPPEMIEEMPPETKPEGDNVQWIPGYFAWDEETSDYLWVSGIWRVPPPGRQWVPGAWSRVAGGYQWSAGFWKPVAVEDLHVVPEPPAPLAEAAPPAPDDNSVLVPGGWVYREARYVWRPGCWVPYRAGWVWVPGYYVCTPCGYVYVEGYWDYVLCDRGLLFAPVCIDFRYVRRGWYYTPCYVVHDTWLLGALFVRGDCGCYFFGDYFDSAYRRRGYTCWLDMRFGRRPDPLFAYYSHHYRRSGWERDLRALYTARFNGDAPRPPRTLVEQQKMVVGGAKGTAIDFKHAVALAPVTKLNTKVMPVVTLDKGKVAEAHKSAAAFHDVSKQRAAAEGQVLAAGTTPKKHGDAVVPIKLDLSKAPVVKESATGKVPPPLPVVIKEEKPVIGGKDVKVPPAKPIDVTPIRGDKDKGPPPARKDVPPPKSTSGSAAVAVKDAKAGDRGKVLPKK